MLVHRKGQVIGEVLFGGNRAYDAHVINPINGDMKFLGTVAEHDRQWQNLDEAVARVKKHQWEVK